MPEIIIRAPNANEEFDRLIYVLKQAHFYRENGYTFTIPNENIFVKLSDKSPNLDNVDWTPIKKYFIENVYDKSFFEKGISELESVRELIESSLTTLVDFHNKWGFVLFDKYQIVLTRYGPGGSYKSKEGLVIVVVNEKWKY